MRFPLASNQLRKPDSLFYVRFHYEVATMEDLVPSLMNLLDVSHITRMSCLANCSGRGECLNGSCYCMIQFQVS